MQRGTHPLPDAMTSIDDDAYLARLSDEQLLTLYIRSNGELKDLKHRYSAEVAPIHGTLVALRDSCTQYMVDNGIDAIKMDDWYARLAYRVVSAAPLDLKLLSTVVGRELTPDAARRKLADINAECAKRHAAWRDKQAKACKKQLRERRAEAMVKYSVATTGKVQRLKRDRLPSDFPDPDNPDHVQALMPRPPEPAVKLLGAAKRPRRPEPPIGRPMTRREALGHLVFELVKERHKVKKPVVTLGDKPGRAARVFEAPKLGPAVVERLSSLKTTAEAYRGARAELQRARRPNKAAMDKCEKKLMAYLHAVEPETARARRTSLAADGSQRTVTVFVEESARAPRSLTMWELSEVVDAAVGRLCDEGVLPDATAPFDAARDLPVVLHDRVTARLLHDLSASAAAVLAAKAKTTSRVCVRRSCVRNGKEVVEEDDDDDDGEDGDNNDGLDDDSDGEGGGDDDDEE